jgi:hypothetical protein
LDGVALSFAVALLLATGASATTTPTATQWKDKTYGYSITLPAKWYVIPRTTSAIEQEITYLKARKQSSLAGAYSAMLKSSASLSELKAYRFQAFLWPPLNSLVPTEVSVQIVTGTHAYTASDLPALGATYANALSANKGSKITVPKRISLPAGPAEFIEGTTPSGGVSTGLELYILVHGKRAYVLSFTIDAKVLTQATVFGSIAEHFAFL